jgi:hypothetical protein
MRNDKFRVDGYKGLTVYGMLACSRTHPRVPRLSVAVYSDSQKFQFLEQWVLGLTLSLSATELPSPM